MSANNPDSEQYPPSQDAAAQLIRLQEQLRRVETPIALQDMAAQSIRLQEQLRRVETPIALQDMAAQLIRQREQLGQFTLNTVAQQLLRQSWLTVESTIRQDFYRDITLGNESFSSLEIEEAVQEFFAPIGESHFFENFLERLRSLKDGIKVIILVIFMHFIMPHFNNLSSSVIYDIVKNNIQPYIYGTSPQSSREVKKSIKNIPNDIDLKSFSEFRIITGDRLRIREWPSIKAKVINELNRGKIVKIIEKRRNWTLIEVTLDDSDKKVQGWVFTRYTLPISR